MEKRTLHIANGDGLSRKLRQTDVSGDVIVWREMLCEGPAVQEIGDEAFIRVRKQFFKEKYNISHEKYQEKFVAELEKLAVINIYEEIILWFEFDLFSHMNMLAVISFLLQNKKDIPLYLVCSGRVKGEQKLLPLSELSKKQLQNYYDHKIHLTHEDTAMATLIWELYCGDKPMQMIGEIKKTTHFEYLPSCLRAHIERFPNANSGLNSLEANVLKLIKIHKITSLHHLLGYALQYQGYYGYDDSQMQRVIEKLHIFFTVKEKQVYLNEEGIKAVSGSKNFYRVLKEDDEFYGGAGKYNFLYDPETHKLLKL